MLPAFVQSTLNAIAPLDATAMQQAQTRQDQLTKPQGSLGRLETLAIQLAGITRHARPHLTRKAIIVMAGDHGVTAEGVSAYPSAVTAQMVANFLEGGAAINVLARQVGARVIVVDMGVASDLPAHRELLVRKIKHGTHNLARGPALTYDEAMRAIVAGIEIINAEIDKGLDLIGVGEMGIGNTTPSSAIVTALTGRPVAEVTGRGTGLDDAGLAHKIHVIEQALELHGLRSLEQPPHPFTGDSAHALDVLQKVGGCEIGGLVGVMLGAAARRLPIVLDGFITGAAALLAATMAPRVKDYFIASHQSVERGHAITLTQLELKPLFDLQLRLGEGTGAALAMPVLEAACRTLNEMATFAEAGVSEKI
jgi:nicotinate-nucleotide--dimethylbenzimidazole phosphoribosyltransferase